MNYTIFIGMLSHLRTTENVLLFIYEYFKNNVTYNYDQLQVVKYNRQEEPLLVNIRNYIKDNKVNKTKEKIMQMLDDAFTKIEGRPLSYRNKKEWFKNFAKTNSIQTDEYPSIYERGMLKDGVCGEYSEWVAKILTELDIPCFKVIGKGTTGHGWNLVYLEDKNIWVNFDMTMVRFYLDGWSKEYGDSNKWVFATTEEMFKLQPQRVIEEIKDINDNVCFKGIINKDNQEELEMFLSELCKVNIKSRKIK